MTPPWQRPRRPDRGLIALLAVLLIGLLVLSLCTGRGPGLTWSSFAGDWQTRLILWEIRLPRTLLAALTGGILGLTGAVLQGWLRNPLADPGVLGLSSMAALAAVAALYFGIGTLAWSVPLAGMLGALVGFLLLRWLSGGEASLLLIILAGATLNAFAAAAIALLLNFAPNPYAIQDLVFWMMGSFEHRTLTDLTLVLLPALLGGALLWRAGPTLDALTLGQDTAVSMGIEPSRLQWQIGLGTALAVGACVSVAGVIGFVGLVVPHLLRPLTAWEPRRLLLPAMLGGALLLVLADIAVRLMPPGPELRIGVLTALLGGPFFLTLLWRLRREEGLE